MRWILDNLWWIIPCLLVLFFLAAYVLPKKKHLRTGQYELAFRTQGQNSAFLKTRPIKKDLNSVLVPFCPVRAKVNCFDPSLGCVFPNFTIESAGKDWNGKRFYIKNPEPINNLDAFKINNMTFKTINELEDTTFYLSGFSINSKTSIMRQGEARIQRKRR